MSTRSKAALKRGSSSQEPEASRKRPIGHRDGSPSNDSRGAQIQTASNHKSTKSGEGKKQISLQNGPAIERAWQGSVEVDCGGMRLEGLPAHLSAKGLSEVMSAHPSATVSRKAYEFSKNFNSKLHLKLLPRGKCYPRIFQDVCPNRDDIALYFYPAKADRLTGIYSAILKNMERDDLMMRSCIDGIELLMFPSSILSADSRQRIENNLFIWGVFYRGNI